jgi:hypothetical protein
MSSCGVSARATWSERSAGARPWANSPAISMARNASQEQLDELCRYVQKTSPVGDIISNVVPIEVSLTVG